MLLKPQGKVSSKTFIVYSEGKSSSPITSFIQSKLAGIVTVIGLVPLFVTVTDSLFVEGTVPELCEESE